jgi:glycosyltransferase involved in cell wall biosynthesis
MRVRKNSMVSIIMNCHNGERYLKKSIDSIINQTYKNWELVFFDNCSSDKSKQIVSDYKNKRIKYFKSKKYLNLYKARNLAIQKSKGNYIAFLDTDDWWCKTKLEEQIIFLKKNKKYKMVYTNFYLYFQNTNKFKKCYYSLPSGSITQKLLNNYTIGILTVLLEKKFFKKFVFNEKYNIVGDFDFFINLSRHYNIGSIDKPLTFYRIHKSNFSIKKVDLYYNELKNWLNFNEKKFLKEKFKLRNIKVLLVKLKLKATLNYFKSIFK